MKNRLVLSYFGCIVVLYVQVKQLGPFCFCNCRSKSQGKHCQRRATLVNLALLWTTFTNGSQHTGAFISKHREYFDMSKASTEDDFHHRSAMTIAEGNRVSNGGRYLPKFANLCR